jgi:1A family penicillin-binding protein
MNKLMRQKRHPIIKLFLLALTLGFFASGSLLLWAATLKTPDLSSFANRKIEQSTKFYDRTGDVLLYDLHEDVQRTLIPYADISRNIKNATVAIEDAEFYEHRGIKPGAILRAVWANITSLGFSQGGSTITQQVVKNTILVTEKKISRKLKEWALAIKLENEYTKEQILEFYLNESPYGGSIYGVEEATQRYFGKSATEVTLGEAAYLAALPQAPTFYSPYGNNKDRLVERKDLVLEKMLENGFISKEELALAKEEVIEFIPLKETGILAPHFVFFVREQLEQKYGRRALEERGFRVLTTLDYKLQQNAQRIVEKHARENTEKFNASNASLVAIDPTSGNILAMVGSRDYFDKEIDGNFNVATAPNRQPGSAFKPFVYAEAIKKGYTPETVVFDAQTQFSTNCKPESLEREGECYAPGNYDNIFRGPVTFREALAQSINIPAIKVLYLAGLSDSLQLAKSMGIASLTNISRYGLTLVLGGGEVSLLDMTSAYGVFAAEGLRSPYNSVLRVEDVDGTVVETYSAGATRVLDKNVARTITGMLSDNDARTPAFGENSYLHFPNKSVAAKTGTTNEYRDAWIIGYTPQIAVGAWAGNNNNSPMEKKVAGFIVAPMWNEFMQTVLTEYGKKEFVAPDPITGYEQLPPILRGKWQGGTTYTIDSISGKLATEYTPQETRKEIVVGETHSILHWIDRGNPRGAPLANPAKDSQYLYWEFGVQKWKAQNNIVDVADTAIPTEYDDIHTPANFPTILVTSPKGDDSFQGGDQINVVLTFGGKYPLTETQFFVNQVFVGDSKRAPFSFSFVPNTVTAIKKKNVLTIVGYDAVRNKTTVTLPFDVAL